MRIAIANWSNRHVGGLETYVANVARALADAGHDLAFWHEGNSPSDRAPIAFPPRVPAFDAAQDLDLSLENLREWGPHLLFVHGMVSPDTERLLIDRAPAVFFGHGYYGTCITGAKTQMSPVPHPCDRLFGPGCLAQFYPKRCGGLSPVTMWTEYRRHAARLDNLARYRGILVFSEHMRREFVRHGIPSERVHRVEPISDVRPAAPRGAKAADGAARVAFAGRLDKIKGCRLLITAMPDVQRLIGRPIELVVVGAGPDEAACRHLADTVTKAHPEVTVTFTGWLSRERADEVLDSIDTFVLPSLLPEPLGLSGLEATRRGVPVAAFRSGGVPEWLEDGVNGALAPADPPTARGLSEAIVRTLTDPTILASTRARSEHGRNATVSTHVKQLESIFAQAASRLEFAGAR